MESRIKKAPKRLKQYEDYMRLVEERMSRLEGKVEWLAKRQLNPSGAKDTRTKGSARRVSIPQLNTTTFKDGHRLGDSLIPPKHYAIEILTRDPTNLELVDVEAATTQPLISHATSATSQASYLPLSDRHHNRRPLPEIIRINSRRIQSVLDYDLWGGKLTYWVGYPFHLLRPFKQIVYQESRIRECLHDFERARQALDPKTEEEYASDFASNPPEDTVKHDHGPNDRSKMTLSELTGFINDLRCLVKFIDDYIKPTQLELQGQPRAIHFFELWYLSNPGTLVYVKNKDIPQKVWRIIQRTGGRMCRSQEDHIRWYRRPQDKFSPFALDCYYIDHDGSRFGAVFRTFSIHKYDAQAVTSLPIFPFDVAIRESMVDRGMLVERGQQFLECMKVCRRYYSGRNHYRAPNGTKLTKLVSETSDNIAVFSEGVDSEVMVDFERAIQEVPDWRPRIDETVITTMDPNEIYEYGIDTDSIWDTRMIEEFQVALVNKLSNWNRSGTPPSDEDLLLLPDRVFAFVLHSRKWGLCSTL